MSLVRFRPKAPRRGFSSSGRAPPCQGGGSEFEPRNPLHFFVRPFVTIKHIAGLAHLVERHLAKVEVASSSLVTRSMEKVLEPLVQGPFVIDVLFRVPWRCSESLVRLIPCSKDGLRQRGLLWKRMCRFLLGKGGSSLEQWTDLGRTQNRRFRLPVPREYWPT